MFTLIENGQVYGPAPSGRTSVLLAGERIAHVGELAEFPLEHERVDASGCVVLPGIIDPHAHLIGGSGEQGWGTQTPEIFIQELVRGGTTTVVGTLGVDTTTKTMPALLAKARGLAVHGITALLWTGGYDVPPVTLTGTVHRDILYIAEVIGAGELALSDARSSAPELAELARIVKQAYTAGVLTGKAGVTHFHMGDGRDRLAPVRALLTGFDVEPAWLYPSHLERNEKLLAEAAELSRAGVTVDVDVIGGDLAKQFRAFLERGGDSARLTASSDAGVTGPWMLWEQVRGCVLHHGFTLEQVLPLITTNTASVLRLRDKARLERGCDADVVIADAESLEICDVWAKGRRLMRDGSVAVRELWLETSNRTVRFDGQAG